jgi:hypothetical protein
MLGDHDDVMSLELSYLPSEYQQQYNDIFGCPIQFNRDKNIMRFSSSLLQRSLKITALPTMQLPSKSVNRP